MRHNQLIGHEGENRAVDYLIKNGYEVLCRNFRCREGELDIIAKDIKANEIVFVEVKTSRCYNGPCIYIRGDY